MRYSIATPPTTLPDLKSIRSTLYSQLATLRPDVRSRLFLPTQKSGGVI